MRNPIRMLLDRAERRMFEQIAAVEQQAVEETFVMFPEWWQDAKPIVEAGVRRLSEGEVHEQELEMHTHINREVALYLAMQVRCASATSRWFEKNVPRLWGTRDQLVAAIRKEDERVKMMFVNLSRFGINPDWLRSHFSV